MWVQYSIAVVKLSIDKLSGNGPGVFKSPEVGLKIANLSIVGVALFTFSRSESSLENVQQNVCFLEEAFGCSLIDVI